MRPKTKLRIAKLLNNLEETARDYIAQGHEHVPQIMGLRLVSGHFVVHTIMLTPGFNTDEEKDTIAQVMGELVEPFDAYIYSAEGWMLILPRDTDPDSDLPRPSLHPDRIETLYIHFVTKLGEELLRSWKIVRPAEGKPYLERFKDSEEPAHGRFANFYRYTVPESSGEA